MAKKFMYVCLGILALTVAFHLGAEYGHALYVDNLSDGVICLFDSDRVLLDNGEVWQCDLVAQTWQFDFERTDLLTSSGVPSSQIKFLYDPGTFVTQSNDFWHYDYRGWWSIGPPPGGGALTQPTTWGQIKAEFWE